MRNKNTFEHSYGLITNMKFDIPIATLLTTYFTACGFAYIWGFWYRTGIDISIILQLVTITEIVKSAALSFLIFLGAAFATVFSCVMTYTDYKENTFFEVSKNPRAFIFSTFMLASLLLTGTVGIYYTQWALQSGDKFYIANSMGFVAAALMFSGVCYKRYVLPNLNAYIRFFTLLTFFMLPPILFLLGGKSYHQNITQSKPLYIYNTDNCTSNKNEAFILLAIYGSKGIGISTSSNALCIFSDSEKSYTQIKNLSMHN